MYNPENDPYDKRMGVEQLASQFEEMLSDNRSTYFDEESYEILSLYYLNNGDDKMSRLVAELGFESYPFSLELALNYINILLDNNEYDKALNIQNQFENIHPNNEDLKLIKAEIFHEMENYEEAIAIYFDLLKSGAENATVIHFQMAQVYQDWGKFEGAVDSYEIVLLENASNEMVLDDYLYCLEEIKNSERGINFLKSATDTDPFNHFYWFNLGIAYNHLNQYEKAKIAFDYSVTIKESFSSGWCHLGHTYVALEDFQNAKDAYKNTLLYERPTAEVYTYLAITYEHLDMFSDAFKYYKLALGLDNTWHEAWFGLGSIMDEQEKHLEAIHFLKKAIEISEYNGDYWLLLADNEYKMGNLILAQEAFQKAADLSPENPDVWLNWSLAYFKLEDYETAFSILKEGIEELPEDADLFFRATAYLIFNRRYNLANQYLMEGLGLDYDKHTQIYDFISNLDTQKAIQRMVNQYKN